ncbi:MAG: hypothetical protein ACUVQ8_00685 [Nitrososphaeria archaeon]
MSVFFSIDPPGKFSKVLCDCLCSSYLLSLVYLLIRFAFGRTPVSVFMPILLMVAFHKYKGIPFLANFLGRATIKELMVVRGIIVKKYSIILKVYPTSGLHAVLELVAASGGRLLAKRNLASTRVYMEFTVRHLIDSRGRSRLLKRVLYLIDEKGLLDLCLLGVPSKDELSQLLADGCKSLDSDDSNLKVELDCMFAFLKALYVLRKQVENADSASGCPEEGIHRVEDVKDGRVVVVRVLSSPNVSLEREQLNLQCLLFSLRPPRNLAHSSQSQKG